MALPAVGDNEGKPCKLDYGNKYPRVVLTPCDVHIPQLFSLRQGAWVHPGFPPDFQQFRNLETGMFELGFSQTPPWGPWPVALNYNMFTSGSAEACVNILATRVRKIFNRTLEQQDSTHSEA